MSCALTTPTLQLKSTSVESIDRIRRLEKALLEHPQTFIQTHHLIHGGVYARTIRIPAGIILTGALIKLPTVLLFNGHATVYNDGKATELSGYHVLPASAGRKQVFYAHADTDLTMLFPSNANSIEEAEEDFTDETAILFSRKHPETNSITITGE